MLLPEFPAYLTRLGGQDYKGLIIGIFTISAGIARPFSGKLADRIGRKPVMLGGLLLGAVCSALYGVVATVFLFFALRFLHGFAVGFTPTGTNALLADLIPLSRRGEAMGIMGLITGVGMSLGPFLGSTLARYYDVGVLFWVSAGMGILALLMLLRVKETVKTRESFSFSLLRLQKDEILEPRVFPVCVAVILAAYAFGAVMTLMPDFSEYTGLSEPRYLFGWGNKAVFLTVFTFSSILMRLISGKASDRYGRPQLLILGNVFVVISMAIVALSRQPVVILLAAVIYGFGVGINATMSVAWTVDLALEQYRGRAVATMFIALEIGIGLGATVSGWLYNNNPANFTLVFGICSILSLTCIGFLVVYLYLSKTNPCTST